MSPDEIEIALRREWWLGHGHTGMYGDDGEMQLHAIANRHRVQSRDRREDR